MASKTVASTAILLTLNLLFFTLVSSTYTPCPPPPAKKTPPTPTPTPKPPKKTPPTPTPTPKTPPAPKKPASCPKDTLKLGVCADILGLVNVVVGTPAKTPCCTLLSGLADLEAALCLCTAIKANVLGIHLNVPVSLSLILNYCGKKTPTGFQCA